MMLAPGPRCPRTAVPRSSPPVANSTPFTLDESLLARRKAAHEQRLYTRQIPAFRAGGFVVLCVIALVQGWRAEAAFPQPGLLVLLALNLGYAAAAGLLLCLGHGRSRLDLSLLLFHLDLLVWLVNLYWLEPGQMIFACFLLVRVADQVGFGFRRALYFGHVVTLAYVAYSLIVGWLQPERALWGERLGITVIIYLLALYLALTGTVTERLRERTRQAMRAARALVKSHADKAQALQAQAAELEQARRQAEMASQAKSQFLAVTSHELRTPMNGILGAADLLASTPLSATQQRYVHTVHHSATTLLALIDDVLDLSRIEAGRLALRPASVDLRTLAAEALELVAMAGRDKPVTLSHAVSPELPARVTADPLRLRQLLVNLLHNALKFTDRGSVRLELQLAQRDGDDLLLRISVRDTGIGIAEDQLESIFAAFTQVDGSSTRRHGGSGLGLAIVKQLVDLMGGRVQVRSRLGEGSHFRVELPLAAAAEPASPPPAIEALDEQGPTVLVAEDDPVNQMVVQEMLRLLGCEVDVVGDGEAAVQAVRQRGYELVFMDCHMPLMDGYEAARRIREDEPLLGRRCTLIALTADALDSDRQRCLDAGMDDFMTKPVSSAQLSATIAHWTGRRTQPATQW